MKKIVPFILGSLLVAGLGACTAKTSSNAPNSTANNGQPPAANTTNANQNDATSKTRLNQLNSDIRAREQRNKAGGDQLARADNDLKSEVRDKLEANIPKSNLTVDAKDGAVTVSGNVPTQNDLNKIEPLAKQIKGVKSVAVKASVAQAKAQ
jgi:hypothetical protein